MASAFRPAMAGLLLCAACAAPPPAATPRPNIDPAALPPAEQAAVPPTPSPGAAEPMADPADAYRSGWMPLAETGVDIFLRAHLGFDGRGVLIAILDTGIDAGVPGLGTTSTGERKILDLRDFTGEGAVPLAPISPDGDAVRIGGRRLTGYSRVAALAAGPVYGGLLAELPLGPAAGDVNGNGVVGDSLPLVIVRASDGWVVFADANGNGSLADDRPIHDYLSGHETFGWSSAGRPSPLTVAVNLTAGAADGPPTLDLFFDNFAHGTHVAGIAAGHDLYGVTGFNGVAPGAFLLGCKIANGAQGGITTTGSMLRALGYAIRFAAERRLPLVVNMSFGVGNEAEGAARIDAALDSVLAAHPDVFFVVSAGNDGPGLSTLGFPASMSRGITVGATLPSTFLTRGTGSQPASPVATFSARGGEIAKPDIVAPGMAYSSVPRWNTGQEREGGTSMAAPHAAGLVALLVSAIAPRRVDLTTMRQALMVTAQPLADGTFLDEGTGMPDVGRALRWLERRRNGPVVEVRMKGPGGSAAFQTGAEGAALDTTATFVLAASRPDTFVLRPSAPWLHAPARVALGAGGTASVRVTYDARTIGAPGVHTGVVTGWTADTTAGPAFRLVNTIVIAAKAGRNLSLTAELPPGGVRRVFFTADSERPFTVRAESAAEGTTLYLQEPGGMPYRGGSDLSAGTGEAAAVYEVGGRDVVPGVYEAVIAAPPLGAAAATLQVRQSPIMLRFARDRTGPIASLVNLADSVLNVRAVAVVAGAERVQPTFARTSAPQFIPFIVPPWARGVVVETTMERAQWERFTDFGVTLFDSGGAQLGTEPLNYAVGRLEVAFPPGHGALPVRIGMFPAFVDSADAARSWSVRTSVRLYADSSVTLRPDQADAPVAVTLPRRGSATIRFALPASPLPMGDGFFPLAAIVAEVGGELWSREAGLSAPIPPVMR